MYFSISEYCATIVSATTVLYRLCLIRIAVISIHILGNMLFLSTSTHALHLFKLLSRTLFLFWWRRFLGDALRSNLILLLLNRLNFFLWGWRLLLNLLLLLYLGWLLIILGIILRLISGTYESSVLVRNGLFRCVTLILVKITWLFRLKSFFYKSLCNGLPNFQAVNVSIIWVFFQSELITMVNSLIFRENIEIFTWSSYKH